MRHPRGNHPPAHVPLVLALVWGFLVLASILAVASVAGGQSLDLHGDHPPGEAPVVQPNGASPATPAAPAQPVFPGEPVKLADVEWAGLMWGTAEGFHPAEIVSAEVDLRVTGLVARARLTQRFENPSDVWLEGVYLFPLPEEAAVDRLRMVIGSRVLEGQIHEKEEARRTYETAKREGKKASLVEQHRPNVFTSRVANVGPRETVEVVIELQQPVRWDAGEMSLRFPTVVNPRYFPGPGTPTIEEGLQPSLLTDASDPLPPEVLAPHRQQSPVQRAAAGAVALASHARQQVASAAGTYAATFAPLLPPPPPVNPVSFRVLLDAGFPLDYLDSPYHAVNVQPAGAHRFEITLADGEVTADRDFELAWAPRMGEEPRSALFREEHDGDVYSLLMVLPPQDGAAGWSPLDREVVFILDTSGSMHGASIEQAKLALGSLLDGLRPGDSFNVIEFNDRARALFPGSLAASPEAVDKARLWVDRLEANGGTNMLPALAAALDGPPPEYGNAGARDVKQVVFLTDGAVGNEQRLFAFIAAHLGTARLFTVGIGSAPNGHFMQRAAEEGRGTYTFIGDPQEVAFKVERLVRKLEGPVLADLEVRWDDPTAEVWPQRLPDLYAGEPLSVAARTVSAGSTVTVAGTRNGAYWETTVPLTAAAATANGGPTAGVRQLWARRKIGSLMGGLAAGVDPAEVRRAVLDVALHHHLVSRYTSLVAVDVTPSRPAGEGLEGAQAPQVMPAGWTPPGSLPVGGTGWPLQLAGGLALLLGGGLLWRRLW